MSFQQQSKMYDDLDAPTTEIKAPDLKPTWGEEAEENPDLAEEGQTKESKKSLTLTRVDGQPLRLASFEIKEPIKNDLSTVLFINVPDGMIQEGTKVSMEQAMNHIASIGKDLYGNFNWFQSGDKRSRFFYAECESMEAAKGYSKILYSVLSDLEDELRPRVSRRNLRIAFAMASKYQEALEKNKAAPGQKFSEPKRNVVVRRRSSPRRSSPRRSDPKGPRRSSPRRSSPRRSSPRRSSPRRSRDVRQARRDRSPRTHRQRTPSRDRNDRRQERKTEQLRREEPTGQKLEQVVIPGFGVYWMPVEEARKAKLTVQSMMMQQQMMQQYQQPAMHMNPAFDSTNGGSFFRQDGTGMSR